MKNKFLILMAEAVVCNLAAMLLLWNIGVERPASLWILAAAHIIIMAAVTVQGHFWLIKPHMDRIKDMEYAVEETRQTAQIRKEFVANVSHELKTPLTSISGFIETLQDGAAEDPEIRTKFIDIIAIETARLKRLIEDLLVLSDIENRRESDGIEFDVCAALYDTIETLRPIAQKKNIGFITEFHDGIFIKGSVDRFRQMMVNLIENAIKYSNEEGRIWVKALRDGEKIVVSVTDEGIGIAPEHHERLFERFYRVDKSRSKKAGGTGLGLSIVKHIAVLFGAALKVESEVGKGTAFFVIFNTEEHMDNS